MPSKKDTEVLENFLQIVQQALVEAGMDNDRAPNLYTSLTLEDSRPSASVTEIEPRSASAADPDDERSEPGLRSSLNVPDEKVARMSSHRASEPDFGGDDEDAGGLFQNMPWEAGDENDASAVDTSSAGGNLAAEDSDTERSAGGFMEDLPWDEISERPKASGSDDVGRENGADRESPVPGEDPGEAGAFMSNINWEGASSAGGSDNGEGAGDVEREESEPAEGPDDAGSFMSNIDWDSANSADTKITVASDSREEPPEHVKKAIGDNPAKNIPPATEDALSRSGKSADDVSEGADDEHDK